MRGMLDYEVDILRKQILMTALLTAWLGLCSVAFANVGRGDSGSEVQQVQSMLINQGYLVDQADGIFGNNTEYSVRAFQQQKGLPVTGYVDWRTMTAIRENNKRFIHSYSGVPNNYRRMLLMDATAYSSEDPGNSNYTAGGHYLQRGYVSVDPSVIPLGTKLYIEGYGYATADDVGGAIVGNRIDLGMNNHVEAINYGRRPVAVYVL